MSMGLATARSFRTPLAILDRAFAADRDLCYLDVPAFPPILFVRDPVLIREICVETANKGDFDRDTLPTQGIGRVVGQENLLYAQGETWQRHKGAAVRPLGTRAVQTEAVFHDLEATIKRALHPQIEELADRVHRSPESWVRMKLEPDIQAVMLNILVNVLFGAEIDHNELRQRYLPAITRVINYILLDTVLNQLRLPILSMPAVSPAHARVKEARRIFEDLVERVLARRDDGAGFWPLLTAVGTPDAIKSNLRVFLAGALEATSSYVAWTLSNLARHPECQEKAYLEALSHPEMTPEAREASIYMKQVLSETLRLNASLFFLPRIALRPTTVTNAAGNLEIPAGTHLMLATYHTNRCERYWGVSLTGFPAEAFVPERWDDENMKAHGRSSKDNLHFGFGHGPRVCVGKHFSEAEAFVCIHLFLKRFRIRAVRPTVGVASGISTRPADQVEVELSLRHFE
jgi:cytochrome P450